VAMGRYAATRSQVDRLVEKAAARSSNYYGDTDKFLFEALARGAREEGGWGLRGRNVIIVGSLVPWYEAICLAEDAASCTTVDHNRVAFEHPHLQHLTIQDWNAMEEPRPLWDMAVSISSVEHAGLGRYGDPIDPDGDLRAMDMIRAMVKPGGYLLLAVPVGADVIKWCVHYMPHHHRVSDYWWWCPLHSCSDCCAPHTGTRIASTGGFGCQCCCTGGRSSHRSASPHSCSMMSTLTRTYSRCLC